MYRIYPNCTSWCLNRGFPKDFQPNPGCTLYNSNDIDNLIPWVIFFVGESSLPQKKPTKQFRYFDVSQFLFWTHGWGDDLRQTILSFVLGDLQLSIFGGLGHSSTFCWGWLPGRKTEFVLETLKIKKLWGLYPSPILSTPFQGSFDSYPCITLYNPV